MLQNLIDVLELKILKFSFAVFITEISGLMHQSRQYYLFVGWVMMGLGTEVEIGVWACGTLCV
jgi:hypothetical protein